MAPYAGFDPEQIKDKARKDLLYLLEGVRSIIALLPPLADHFLDSREKKLNSRGESCWTTGCICQVLDLAGLWCR